MPAQRPEGAIAAIRVSRTGRVWVDAGRLSVDFVMTGPWPQAGPAGSKWEGITQPSDLEDWFTACDLQLGVVVPPAELARALTLRGAVWDLVRARVHGGTRPRTAVRTVNEYAAGCPLAPQLTRAGRAWRAPTCAQALSTIARDTVELHADDRQLARLRECSSDDCPRVFYDTSRPGTRRWCDPVRCGDRQRSRRYRAHTPGEQRQSTPGTTPAAPGR